MTPGLRTLTLAAALGWAAITPAPAQDAIQAELQSLRKAIETQNDQIARLTTEVARLTALVDGPRRAAVPAPAAPGATPGAEAPAAEPVRPPVVPPAPVHVVVKGDSLDKIAKQHGVTVVELQKLNRISDPKKLQIGQQLNLPPNAVPNAEKKDASEKKEPQ